MTDQFRAYASDEGDATHYIDTTVEEALSNPNASHVDLQNAAKFAAINGNVDQLNALADKGAILDEIPRNEDGQATGLSPLGNLKFLGHNDAFTSLGNRYDLNSTRSEVMDRMLDGLAAPRVTEDMDSLHSNMSEKLETTIKSLVTEGAQFSDPNSTWTQDNLRRALANDHADILEFLAEKKIIDLDQKGQDGQSLRDIMNKGKDPTPTPSGGFDQANFDARLAQLQDESGRTWTHRGGIANYVFTEVSDAKTAAQLSHDLNNAGVHSVFSGDDIEKGKVIVAIPADELATLDASRTANAATATKSLLGVEQEPAASSGLDTGWQSPAPSQQPPPPTR